MKPELIPIFIFILAPYLILFGVGYYAQKKNSFKLFSQTGWVNEIPTLYLNLIVGIILFGLIPFWVFGYQRSTNILIGNDLPTLKNLLFVFVSVFLAVKTGLKESNLFSLNLPSAYYRQEKPKEYYTQSYFYYRSLYLMAYEFWFRGILLFTLLHHFQLIPAIFINILLYSLLHSFLDKREFWLCFPFGAYLCFLCWWIGAAWPAMLIHLALSLSFELNFVLRNRYKYQNI